MFGGRSFSFRLGFRFGHYYFCMTGRRAARRGDATGALSEGAAAAAELGPVGEEWRPTI
jgi:hypothetical protein